MKPSVPTATKPSRLTRLAYADILKQVRDSTFEQQLHERLELAEKDKQSAVELAKAQLTSELQKQPQPRMLKSRHCKPR